MSTSADRALKQLGSTNEGRRRAQRDSRKRLVLVYTSTIAEMVGQGLFISVVEWRGGAQGLQSKKAQYSGQQKERRGFSKDVVLIKHQL